MLDTSVSAVSDPSSVVTSAAYLLFYRRRANVPLGGSRFVEIFHKFDKPNHSDEDSDTEVGDNDRSDELFYENSRLNIEGKTAAFRPRGDRESTTTITPLVNSDDDDNELPAYDSATTGRSIRPSVEDEGVDMADTDQSITSNPLTQHWSFSGLPAGTGDDSATGGYASDEVQANSTGDERQNSHEARDQDVDMNSVTASLSDTEDGVSTTTRNMRGGNDDPWGLEDVVPVLEQRNTMDRDSDEVAEIHVDGDKAK